MLVIITAVGDAKDATMIIIILVVIFLIKGTLDILGNAKDAMMIVIKEQVCHDADDNDQHAPIIIMDVVISFRAALVMQRMLR